VSKKPRVVQPIVDRVPPLPDLVRGDDLTRCISGFLGGGVDGIMVFTLDGAPHGGTALPSSPMARWSQLPVEAQEVVQRGPAESFGVDDHVFDVRLCYAGTDRVAILVVSRRVDSTDPRDTAMADAMFNVVAQLLQAGFATWVTSELHLASQAEHYRVLTQQNAELQRAVEHLREIDELKSNFLATVSHELRTPLTSVIGFAEMLAEGLAGELASEQREYVETILHRAEELMQLISRVLEMSQLEVGAMRLDLRSTPLAPIVERAIEAMAKASEDKGISISCEIAPLGPVLVDPEKIHRVLLNLIGNALKFSASGTQIDVRAVAAPIRRPFHEETLFGEEIDDAVRVCVVDRGIGIPADKLGRVFEAFYQVDASSTREHGGAGLGLSIVANLVQAHGGDVWAESEVGVGTTIHFTLPLASSDAAPG
jgi:signal transduction histidine kinase